MARNSKCAVIACTPAGRSNTSDRDKASAPIPSSMSVIFLWHSLMISAADRESAYVIDGLMCNDVVKSDIHSTDTHGYTEAVFGLTHLLGFSFAPRIKGVGKQTLYIFKPINQGARDWAIRPDKTINEAVLRENWDDLLRLVATIKLKENTASDIFRRLNSYSRQHAIYQDSEGIWTDHQIPVHPALHRRSHPAPGYQGVSSTRLSWPTVSPAPWPSATPVSSPKWKRKNRKSQRPATALIKKQHHLLELSLPDQTG